VEVISLPIGPLATNCYLLRDESTGRGAIMDPGDEGERLARRIENEDIDLAYILLTHGHWDHVGAVGAIKSAFPDAEICIGRGDAEALTDPHGNLSTMLGAAMTAPGADRILDAGDEVTFGETALDVRETPGHTPGGITFVALDEDPPVAFPGDLIFRRAVGRVDFPGGSGEQLVRSIREQIFTLPDETVLYCGHEQPTTVGEERRENPFVS
jgi:glyoxylase-like metal-dependent hydrolase (beta-lactamase superfamily II)